MTFSEKIGYNLGSVINKFKHWQASKWLKAVIILGIFSLLFALFYYLITAIVLFVLIIGLKHFSNLSERNYLITGEADINDDIEQYSLYSDNETPVNTWGE